MIHADMYALCWHIYYCSQECNKVLDKLKDAHLIDISVAHAYVGKLLRYEAYEACVTDFEQIWYPS